MNTYTNAWVLRLLFFLFLILYPYFPSVFGWFKRYPHLCIYGVKLQMPRWYGLGGWKVSLGLVLTLYRLHSKVDMSKLCNHLLSKNHKLRLFRYLPDPNAVRLLAPFG